jgi:uncharacterized membrane protein
MKAKNFFSKTQQLEIENAIASAELNTSGEIRLHIVTHCKNDPKIEAVNVFSKLKMHLTEQRNGVLILLAVEDRKFAIIGDKGINELVPENFWDSIRDKMVYHFKQDQFDIGIIEGIKEIGNKLKHFFPIQKNDINELSNEISYDE